MPKSRPPYPEEFRREAVRLIRSGQRTLAEASASLGVSQQTLRNWLKQTDVDAGRAEGVSSVLSAAVDGDGRAVVGGDGGG